MPKKQQIMRFSTTSDSSKNYIEDDWLKLKQEYEAATKHKKSQEKLILEKEKDDFEKLWIAAGNDVYDKSGKLLPACKKRN
tara:strand:+ start:2325 stop:2567 length:243 start_codon:yes stop_codon:yes gene_type:complete